MTTQAIERRSSAGREVLGIFNSDNQKLANYSYEEIVAPAEIYNNYNEANQYIIDWHVWWNLGAPKLFPEIKSPLMVGDELGILSSAFYDSLSPWGRNIPTLADLDNLLIHRKPREDLIKLGLKGRGVSPLMAETVILFLRCLDYQNRSASFIQKLDHSNSRSSRAGSVIYQIYPIYRKSDCASDFQIFDPLDEIESAHLEIGGQQREFKKQNNKYWKLNLFWAPYPPLPIVKLYYQETRVRIVHKNSIRDTSSVSLEFRHTLVNQSRRKMFHNNRIDGDAENLRWRSAGGMLWIY